MTFGDGTLILSNRQTDAGVEVMATAEGSLDQLQPGEFVPLTGDLIKAIPAGAFILCMFAASLLFGLAMMRNISSQTLILAGIALLFLFQSLSILSILNN